MPIFRAGTWLGLGLVAGLNVGLLAGLKLFFKGVRWLACHMAYTGVQLVASV